ncbi:hypothetical protein B0H34DRAFT_727430 [Crassisporium funariophilum]|nr:hypothetical protein B0H34DRAFT_727430 [Crassisporium funariophilum]
MTSSTVGTDSPLFPIINGLQTQAATMKTRLYGDYPEYTVNGTTLSQVPAFVDQPFDNLADFSLCGTKVRILSRILAPPMSQKSSRDAHSKEFWNSHDTIYEVATNGGRYDVRTRHSHYLSSRSYAERNVQATPSTQRLYRYDVTYTARPPTHGKNFFTLGNHLIKDPPEYLIS